MKKALYIFILVPLMLVVTSCGDFLTEEPVSQLSVEQFWKTESDINAAVAGMYDGIQAVVDDRYIDWGEGRSDNLTNGGTGITEINFALNGLTADMANVSWDNLYRVVLRANQILKYTPLITITDFTQTEKNHYMAQAYAMRAYCHLLGIKVWGDVPLVLEPVTDRNTKPFRTPVSDVLAQVVVDLTTAGELINRTNKNVYEINYGVILAILTDTYMWQKDYDRVIETTDELMTRGYVLAQTPEDWNRIFTDPANSKEAIWSIFWEFEQDGANGLAGKLGSSTNTSPFEIDDNLLVRWEEQKKDFRRYLTYDTLQAPTRAVTDIHKHYPIVNGKQALPPTNEAVVQNSLYRLADILLLRAEAFNQLEDEPAAVALLNQIKVRAKVAPVTEDMFNSVDELEKAILDERQFELFAEGKRWFDLRRTGNVVAVMDPLLRQRQQARGLTVVGFLHPEMELFPISRDALNENTNLEQNYPYSR
jgi:hypothetical protein